MVDWLEKKKWVSCWCLPASLPHTAMGNVYNAFAVYDERPIDRKRGVDSFVGLPCLVPLRPVAAAGCRLSHAGSRWFYVLPWFFKGNFAQFYEAKCGNEIGKKCQARQYLVTSQNKSATSARNLVHAGKWWTVKFRSRERQHGFAIRDTSVHVPFTMNFSKIENYPWKWTERRVIRWFGFVCDPESELDQFTGSGIVCDRVSLWLHVLVQIQIQR